MPSRKTESVFLKVKVKSLAEEARIIRKEERIQANHGWFDDGCNWNARELHAALHWHRVGILRAHARSANLAYGFCKGRKYKQMERNPKSAPNWKEVCRLIKKYGPVNTRESTSRSMSLLPEQARAKAA